MWSFAQSGSDGFPSLWWDANLLCKLVVGSRASIWLKSEWGGEGCFVMAVCSSLRTFLMSSCPLEVRAPLFVALRSCFIGTLSSLTFLRVVMVLWCKGFFSPNHFCVLKFVFVHFPYLFVWFSFMFVDLLTCLVILGYLHIFVSRGPGSCLETLCPWV